MPARLVFLLVLLSAFMVVPSALDLLTEWLWFSEVDYTGIFMRTLGTRLALGAVVFVLAFAGLALNFRLALGRLRQPYTLFPGNGEIQAVVLTPQQLQRLGTGVAALMALFLGAFASNEWLTWLQFRNAVPFDQADPLFGRDIGFYVFSLPFIDLVRYLALAVVMLSLLGSAAIYVISNQLGIDPARGPIVSDGARRHLGLIVAGVFVLLAWGAYLDVPGSSRPRPGPSTARRTST